MRAMNWKNRIAIPVAVSLLALQAAWANPASAEQATLSPSRDTTIYSDGANNSNALGEAFSVGKNNSGGTRRALIGFDLSSLSPPGSRAIIDHATLNLYLIGASGSTTTQADVSLSLYVLPDLGSTSWGEGQSSSSAFSGGGRGVAATTGDATWQNLRYQSGASIPWANAGAVASMGDAIHANDWSWKGVKVNTNESLVSMNLDPQLTGLQGWADGTIPNHGWVLLGDESKNGTKLDFASRDAGSKSPSELPSAYRPTLVIDYHLVPEPSALVACAACMLAMAGIGLLRHTRNPGRSRR